MNLSLEPRARSADKQHGGHGRGCCFHGCCCRLPARVQGCCSTKLPRAAVAAAVVAAAVVVAAVVVAAVAVAAVVLAVRCCLLEIADVQTLSQGDCQAKNLPMSRILSVGSLVSAYHAHQQMHN